MSDENLEEIEPIELEVVEAEAAPEENAEGQGDDELVIEVDGLDEAEEETPAIRKLRERVRNQARRIREMEALSEPEIVIGDEPTLENCEWDDERFQREWREWSDRKSGAEKQKAERDKAADAEQQRWNSDLSSYRTRAAKLNVPDYDAMEKAVGEALPLPVGNAVIRYFGDEAPKLVVALHKHPKLLEEVADTAAEDPLKAIFRLYDIAKGIKVERRKSSVKPEEVLTGTAAVVSGSTDKKLSELEKKAQQSGNWDEYFRQKRLAKSANA